VPANYQYDVFLSHNPQDKPRVRRLAERLRDAGLRVWFDAWAIQRGWPLTIRWMNVSEYLRRREDKESRQIVFDGEELTMEAVWRVRDRLFPPR
jgi:hypothetical protein